MSHRRRGSRRKSENEPQNPSQQQREIQRNPTVAELLNSTSSATPFVSQIRSSLQEPLSEAERSIHSHAKRKLRRAYRQITTMEVSDWLFNEPRLPFQINQLFPNPSFSNSIVLNMTQSTSTSSSSLGNMTSNLVLLVPVMMKNSSLLGYTFGSKTSAPSTFVHSNSNDTPIFNHYVGRFSYHSSSHDLLLVCHARRDMAISNIRRVHHSTSTVQRERTNFIVRPDIINANSSVHMPEEEIVSAVDSIERLIQPSNVYQFSTQLASSSTQPTSPSASSSSHITERRLRAATESMERFLRGTYYGDRMVHDEMDHRTGRLMTRKTETVQLEFGLADAVQLTQLKDIAVRKYYSYASAHSTSSQAANLAAQRRYPS